MIHRVLLLISAAIAVTVPVFAQGSSSVPASGAKAKPTIWTIPRTTDGHPDLQGNWTNATLTPLERPTQFAGKAILSKTEAEAYLERRLESTHPDESPISPSASASVAVLTRNFMRVEPDLPWSMEPSEAR